MAEEKSEKKLFLLDAYALIFRAYYAFIKNPRINSKGLNTSAIFGFTNTLIEVLEKQSPSHIAVVFDHKSENVRKQEYKEYKANRDATPEDIKLSEPYIRKVIEGFNIPILEAAGYEADDVIGTLAKKAEKEGFITYMMTPDKDFGQLVTENILMFKPARGGGGPEILGPKEVCEKFGVDDPLQVIDILGMWGDAVDNIPGIPGVGEKTASKLVKQYGSMEGLYENTNELKGKMKEKVEANKDLAFLSKKLATILLDAPVAFEPDKLIIEKPNSEQLKELFSELEFRKMAERVLGETISFAQPKTSAPAAGGQMDLFGSPTTESVQGSELIEEPKEDDNGPKTIENSYHEYHFTDTPEKRKSLISILKYQPSFCFDTETTGLDPLLAELVGMSFAVSAFEAFYVPVPSDREEATAIVEEFKFLFEDNKTEKVGQNLKYDILVLHKYGVNVRGTFFDTMLAHYLLEPDVRRHGMDYLSEVFLNYTPVSITTIIGPKGKKQKSMRDVPQEEISDYACEDADITLRLKRLFEPMLKENNLMDLFRNVEAPLLGVLAQMEKEGIRLDAESLKTLSDELLADVLQIEEEIYKLAGMQFNIASPRQVGEVLFDHLKIDDKPKKTKTGQYQTNEDTLKKLESKHEIVGKIFDFRELVKLRNTYVDPLPQLVHEDGRIHTTYNQVIAATGRLSSESPNLQNIPVRTERGREIRKSFIARDTNHLLLAADYSQVELRILASLSKDAGMIEAFKNNEDIHASTAAKVFGVSPEDVDREMRSKAKAVNFGIAYGQGAFGLAQNLNISRGEAKEIIDSYFTKFANVKNYMDESIELARENGYCKTVMGRVLRLRDINSANHMVRSQAERIAINAPIQGSAADVIKVAMINIHKWLSNSDYKTKMLLQVHDELIFDVPKEEMEEIRPIVEREMTNAYTLEVPLVVDSGIGENWLEAH
ncbi:MAG: DNA polymerase I [Crocinitomicaceae bacterium]|nr:DNA polymerase I [Crocinitomicaceae bacterium]|tara:strand:+ start:14520 stop:17351 length:2832 start_codon:yes stop_codon:yes gene_type:complete